MKNLLCLLIAVAAPLSAVARCPVPADLEAGVVIEYVGGAREVYRRVSEDVVIVEGLSDDVVTHRLTLLHGAYLQRYVAVEDGVEIESAATDYAYPTGDAAPRRPFVNLNWEGVTQITEGGITRDELQVHEAGGLFVRSLGDCSYGAITLTLTYGEAADYVETVHYFPQLGMGYLAAYQNGGRDPRQQAVVSFEALVP